MPKARSRQGARPLRVAGVAIWQSQPPSAGIRGVVADAPPELVAPAPPDEKRAGVNGRHSVLGAPPPALHAPSKAQSVGQSALQIAALFPGPQVSAPRTSVRCKSGNRQPRSRPKSASGENPSSKPSRVSSAQT